MKKTSGKKLSYERLLSIVLALVLLCGICSPGSMLSTVAKAEDSEAAVTYDLSYYMTQLSSLQSQAANGGDKQSLYVKLMLLWSDAEKNLSTDDYEAFGDAAAPLVDYLMNEDTSTYADYTYTVTVAPGESGTVTISGNNSYTWTSNQTGVSCTNSRSTATVTVASTVPEGTYQVTASSSRNTYTITVIVSASGSSGGGNTGGNTGGGGSSGETLDIGYWREDIDVYWDETDGTAASDSDTIVSVTLNSIAVQEANSDLGSGWDGSPLTTGDYFPNASTSNNQQVQLAITPEAGYYVQRIIVACCPASVAPYNCSTWQAGNALDMTLAFTEAGTLYIPVNAQAFCHDSNDKENSHQYFILIQTAPLPSPLLVEYDYGIIGGIVGTTDTPFATANGWTTAASSNVYDGDAVASGSDITVTDINGGIDVTVSGVDMTSGVTTSNTQFVYAYDEAEDAYKAAVAAQWSHTSNSITPEAIAAAAAAGYRFTGWAATYYAAASVSENAAGSYNNYTYNFSSTYSTATYGEGVNVPLYNHVRLVAQWEPVTMSVTKTVAGLTGSFLTDHSYTLQVQKQNDNGEWVNFGDAMTLTVNGNGTATATVTNAVVTPGTYRVVETAGNTNLVLGDVTMYISVEEDDELTVTAADLQDESKTYNLSVTNTYGDTTPTDTTFIKVQKNFMGITADQIPADFTITVTAADGTVYTVNSANASKSADGLIWTWTLSGLEAGTYTVSETNYEIPDYIVTTEGTGTVQTQDAKITIVDGVVVNNCNKTTWNIGERTFIVAKLTSNAGYFVWTNETLSAGQRAAFIQALVDSKLLGGMSLADEFFFYSGDKISDADGLMFREGYVKYDGVDVLYFSNPDQWAKFAYGSFHIDTDSATAEIEVTNSYRQNNASVSVSKQVTGNMSDRSEVFNFTAILSGGTMTPGSYTDAHGIGYTVAADGVTVTFSLTHDQTVTITDVPVDAVLTLTETNSGNYTVAFAGATATAAATATATVYDGLTIIVTNNYDVLVPTGVARDVLPFALMLGLVAAGAVLMLRRRRYDCE